MLLVDDLAAGGTKNLRHTPRGLVTLLSMNGKQYVVVIPWVVCLYVKIIHEL